MKPIVWTIAGSDSSGGAGIQADLHTIAALGAHGCSVITALTAQNSVTLNHIQMTSPENLASQINTLDADLPAKALKIGMIGNVQSLNIIVDFLKHYSGFVVVDPVLKATNGKLLSDPELIHAYVDAASFVDLITPNLHEAEALLNCKIHSNNDIKTAANQLLNLGFENVLIKGGHSHFSADDSQDYWTNGADSFWLTNKKINTKHTHGTGCCLSSAIATCVALGYDLKDALVIGKMYVTQAIRAAKALGQGPGAVAHLGWPENSIDLPALTHSSSIAHYQFPKIKNIGLYPIVDRAHWLEILLPLGVKTIQLRVKDLTGNDLENEIQTAVAISKEYDAQLFINDYWQFAIKHKAFGVHLGQEDIDNADFRAIETNGLAFGISTHSYAELARAIALNPSYLALGPIYPTTSKVMKFSAQGIANLQRWRNMANCPLVAIGGINQNNIEDIIRCKPDGVAMISSITQSDDPMTTTQQLRAYF